MISRRAQSPVRWVLWVGIALGVLVGGTVLALRVLRPTVTVTEAVVGPVVQAFYSTGTIEPDREYPIRANREGILTAVHVDKGDRVTAGQALAVVDDPELTYLAQQAEAELAERRARAQPETSPVLAEYRARIDAATELLEIARREERRLEGLIGQSAASQTDLDRALERVENYVADIAMAEAQMAAKQLELEKDVRLAEARLNIARWNLEQQTLKSPIDGTVLDWPLSIGTRVAVNDQVMRIADVRPANLVMRAAVDEEDITHVQPDQRVHMTLYAFPGRTFAGQVVQIYDQADVSRRTFEVDVRLDEPNDRLQPGMTGELAFILDFKDEALVVPSQAVQNGAVYVVRDDAIQKVDVTLGITSVERTEIVTGLQPGDRVVISPVGSLQPGQTVRTTFMDPIAAAGLNKVAVEEKPFGAFD